MKCLLLAGLCTAGLLFTGCVDDSDVSVNKLENSDIDVDFSFTTRSANYVSIRAINSMGQPTADVLFGIYSQNPYEVTEEGELSRLESVKPLYRGYTNASGEFSAAISVPNGATKLYLMPEYAGFGPMQEVTLEQAASGVELKGVQVSASSSNRAKASAAKTEMIERDAVRLGVNTIFFHYFNDQEINLSDGSLNIGNGLVSYENLSTAFLEDVNNFFPEKVQNYTGNEETTDMLISSEYGAEVWVTYIGDGGFTSSRTLSNGMYYYTYTDDNKPSRPYGPNYTASDEYHLTAIFPNVNLYHIAIGTKVQLLYWDEAKQKYVSTFPKGTYIGFALNHYGYNPGMSERNYGFSLSNKNGNPYCSTKEFNSDGRIHAVTHFNEKFSSYVIGLERAGLDNDFNDIMAKITSNPIKQTLTGEVAPPAVEDVYYSRSGTLAFEDNWPSKGDYDFNDFVVEYEYTLKKKDVSTRITSVDLKFTPKASGGAKINGFGIQLPVDRSNIQTLPSDVEVENDVDLLTMIIYNNVHDGFVNAPSGFVNTYNNTTSYEGETVEIHLDLINPVDENVLKFDAFNPFLFTSTRDHEIHLVNYAPTSKMNTRLFGSGSDFSDPSKNVYFRMDNNFPWALDICDTNWKWAYENLKEGIRYAYPDYSKWYESWKEGKTVDWIDNVNEDYIWKK